MAIAGVYEIRNIATGDFYIGSSSNIERRLYDHRRKLSNNRHINPHLQNSWNKHGADNFTFETILLCDEYMTLYCEQEILDQLKPAYNIATCAAASARGLTRTLETRALMSTAHMGRNKGIPLSAATREKMSEAAKCNTRSLGYEHTEEHNRNISEAQKGTLNHNFGKAPWNKGKKNLRERGEL